MPSIQPQTKEAMFSQTGTKKALFVGDVIFLSVTAVYRITVKS